MLPRISSNDLGQPSEPGDYGFGDALVRVDRHHVEVWRERPDATFPTILLTRMGDSALRLALGASAVSA